LTWLVCRLTVTHNGVSCCFAYLNYTDDWIICLGLLARYPDWQMYGQSVSSGQ